MQSVSAERCCRPPSPIPAADLAAARARFAGQRMVYIVSQSAGGGYDRYARLIARHLPRHLPVRNVLVRNISGGAQERALRALVEARPDGLTLGTFNSGVLMNPDGVSIDPGRLSWVGNAASDGRAFLVTAGSALLRADDLAGLGRPLRYASSSVNASSHQQMQWLANALGFTAQPVFGFDRAEADLALWRGDVEAAVTAQASARTLLDRGAARVLFYVGEPAGGLPAAPQLASLLPPDQAVGPVELIEATSRFARITAAPPDTPAATLAVLREAYLATLRDPALLREAARAQLVLEPVAGAILETELTRLMQRWRTVREQAAPVADQP